MRNLKELISQAPVFRKFTDEQKEAAYNLALCKTYQKKETILLDGTVWPFVIIVADGLIHANKESPEGRCLTVRTISVGEVFWGHGIFGHYPTPTSLIAVKTTVVYQWYAQELLPLVMENNEGLWDLCIQLNHRMLEASITIEDIAFNPVVNRLARLLIDQFNLEQQPFINRKMTLEEMASKIGTTREVVCRLLYRFSEQNLIHVDRTKFILVNRMELNKVAEGELLLSSESCN